MVKRGRDQGRAGRCGSTPSWSRRARTDADVAAQRAPSCVVSVKYLVSGGVDAFFRANELHAARFTIADRLNFLRIADLGYGKDYRMTCESPDCRTEDEAALSPSQSDIKQLLRKSAREPGIDLMQNRAVPLGKRRFGSKRIIGMHFAEKFM